MSSLVLLIVVALLLAINVFLWKFGFIHQAERPHAVLDKPVMDGRERNALLKRLKRWKGEGKLKAEEFETFVRLCEEEWGPSA